MTCSQPSPSTEINYTWPILLGLSRSNNIWNSNIRRQNMYYNIKSFNVFKEMKKRSIIDKNSTSGKISLL